MPGPYRYHTNMYEIFFSLSSVELLLTTTLNQLCFSRKRSQAQFSSAVRQLKENAGKASDSGAAMKTALGKLMIHFFW